MTDIWVTFSKNEPTKSERARERDVKRVAALQDNFIISQETRFVFNIP